MGAGKYRHQITIQRRTVTRDPSYGSEIVAWADVATVKAQFDPIRGREYFSAKQERAESTVRFRIYYRPDVVPEMRIVFNGKNYDIDDAMDVGGLRKELELITIEGLTNG
jgi:SPP1 family predicted phage head-tail adaptor